MWVIPTFFVVSGWVELLGFLGLNCYKLPNQIDKRIFVSARG